MLYKVPVLVLEVKVKASVYCREHKLELANSKRQNTKLVEADMKLNWTTRRTNYIILILVHLLD
jgi:hypothetical protein